MPSRREWPELGSDQLDAPALPGKARSRWLTSRRPALGVRATAVPALTFVLLGAAIGPSGLNVLSRTALDNMQAVVWVALAVIGVFVGLGLAAAGADRSARTVTCSAIVAVGTTAMVATGLYLLVSLTGTPLQGNVLAAAILAGLCASVSAALHTGSTEESGASRAAGVADLDDLPVVAVGVAIIAGLAGGDATLRLLATVAAGAAVGVAGWLLFEHASEPERIVFVTGAILLLAGIGAYLGTSPLLSGCVAALVWVRAPGAADRITAADLRTLQHPLVALLLVVAGALVQWAPLALWLAAFLVVLRLAAKLLVSVLVAPIARVSPAVLATVLLPPGVMGIALSLNAGSLLGDDYRWLVSAVTVSSVASELLAMLLPDTAEDAT